MFKKINKLFVYTLITAFSFISFTLPARAAMIGTEQVMAAETVSQDHARIADALNRPDVVAQLESFGVSKADAEARVAALTDAEAASLANQIDSLPAGGDFLSVLGFVVIALVITDLIGITSVFPFIRPVTGSSGDN